MGQGLAAAKDGGGPPVRSCRVVLVTTNLWLATLQERPALVKRLDETARKANPSCVGASLLTFEEIAEDWRHALGQAVLPPGAGPTCLDWRP